MKNFVYCEAQDGDMYEFFFNDVKGLKNLFGWMSYSCKEDDEELSKWISNADVGDYFQHRLGFVVRLKDVEV